MYQLIINEPQLLDLAPRWHLRTHLLYTGGSTSVDNHIKVKEQDIDRWAVDLANLESVRGIQRQYSGVSSQMMHSALADSM
jgi:hypothetical protein